MIVLVPEQLISAIRYGEPVTATLPGIQDAVVKGRIIEIRSDRGSRQCVPRPRPSR